MLEQYTSPWTMLSWATIQAPPSASRASHRRLLGERQRVQELRRTCHHDTSPRTWRIVPKISSNYRGGLPGNSSGEELVIMRICAYPNISVCFDMHNMTTWSLEKVNHNLHIRGRESDLTTQ